MIRVVIEDASVVKEPSADADKPQDSGVMNTLGLNRLFGAEKPDMYKGRIALRLEMVDESAPDIVIAHANIEANRETEVSGAASLAEKDKAFYDMTQNMVGDLAGGLKSVVDTTFNKP